MTEEATTIISSTDCLDLQPQLPHSVILSPLLKLNSHFVRRCCRHICSAVRRSDRNFGETSHLSWQVITKCICNVIFRGVSLSRLPVSSCSHAGWNLLNYFCKCFCPARGIKTKISCILLFTAECFIRYRFTLTARQQQWRTSLNSRWTQTC